MFVALGNPRGDCGWCTKIIFLDRGHAHLLCAIPVLVYVLLKQPNNLLDMGFLLRESLIIESEKLIEVMQMDFSVVSLF